MRAVSSSMRSSIELPIWKKEHYRSGNSGWVNCERCATAPAHAHSHTHASVPIVQPMQPDYSRQILLKEVGPAGQAVLAGSRVLVVGAGGLGSPVLQYLAGAGVGHLTVIDADILEPSNLHRQPIYALHDVGTAKATLAAAAISKLNPTLQIEALAVRFTAANALELIRAHDLVVDCSDNFRTKFLINDSAVLAQRPAVFASVYQYEGQLQVYRPTGAHACLRCLWPDASVDGVVGNCAEAGVLGPGPGRLRCVAGLVDPEDPARHAGAAGGELLLVDLMSFTSTKMKAPRRPECAAPGCALHPWSGCASRQTCRSNCPSLDEVGAYTLIDIRTDAEVARKPAPGTSHRDVGAACQSRGSFFRYSLSSAVRVRQPQSRGCARIARQGIRRQVACQGLARIFLKCKSFSADEYSARGDRSKCGGNWAARRAAVTLEPEVSRIAVETDACEPEE